MCRCKWDNTRINESYMNTRPIIRIRFRPEKKLFFTCNPKDFNLIIAACKIEVTKEQTQYPFEALWRLVSKYLIIYESFSCINFSYRESSGGKRSGKFKIETVPAMRNGMDQSSFSPDWTRTVKQTISSSTFKRFIFHLNHQTLVNERERFWIDGHFD